MKLSYTLKNKTCQKKTEIQKYKTVRIITEECALKKTKERENVRPEIENCSDPYFPNKQIHDLHHSQ